MDIFGRVFVPWWKAYQSWDNMFGWLFHWNCQSNPKQRNHQIIFWSQNYFLWICINSVDSPVDRLNEHERRHLSDFEETKAHRGFRDYFLFSLFTHLNLELLPYTRLLHSITKSIKLASTPQNILLQIRIMALYNI